jgi:PAS domain S-box-containing protein
MGEESKTNMNTSTESKKSSRASVRKKVRNYLVLFSVQSVIIIILILYFTSRKNFLDEGYQRLSAVNLTLKEQLEEKVEALKDHARVLSANQTIVDAMEKFRYQFRMMNADTTLLFSENEFENAEINLRSYYNAHVLNPVNDRLNSNHTVEEYFPADRRTKLVQHLYISSNPNPPGEKHLLDKGMDYSQYSKVHLAFHPFLRHVVENYDLKDLFLIDNESGYIVYSSAKHVDFGTSLISGPYRDTKLAKTFKNATQTNARDAVMISDVEYSHPAGASPVFYVASPVFKENNKIGVLILEIALEEIEEIVSVAEKDNGILGKSGENLIVGNDFRTRNTIRQFIEDPKAFQLGLRKQNVDKDLIQQMYSLESTSLLYPVNSDVVLKAMQGEHGQDKMVLPDGSEKVVAYSPLEISGLNWALLTAQNQAELGTEGRRILIIALISSVLLLAFVYFISNKLTLILFGPLEDIRSGISRLSRGEVLEKQNTENNRQDEFGTTLVSLNTLNERIQGASEFARSLGQNDFNASYAPVSDADQLGKSLNEMKDSLVQAKQDEEKRAMEDQKRNWSTQGIAKFSDILRLNNDNIETLSYTIVSNMVEYLNANQAGIFITNEEEGEERSLELSAAYAFDRRKYISRKVQFGEGMVGACALEKKTMYMKEVPDNYIHITSGLGEANPKSLLIVPMLVEEEVLGVIEIASFNEFEPHEIEFVEKIAETIGSTIVTAKVNARTAKLLEESKTRTEEMAAQEEEMRQNMEELQATQEEMRRIKDEEARKEKERRDSEEEIKKKLQEQNDKLKNDEEILQKQKEALSKEKYLMDALMESVPDHIYFKDKDSRFIRFSNSMLKLFGLKSEQELMGKSDFDFFSKEHAQPAFEDEQNIIKTGQAIIDKTEKEVFDDGKVSWVNTSKLPLKDAEGNIVGTFGISKNITHLKELEIEANKKAETIASLETELAQLKKSALNDEKDKKIKKLENDLQTKNKELDRIREETDRTRNQIETLRGKKKK